MQEEIIKKAINILETDEDYLVPVKKLHKDLKEEFKTLKFEELVNFFEKDKRFKVYSEKNETGWPEEEEAKMESLGHYAGPRVMLVSRTPSKEEIAATLQKKTQSMLENLKKAYESKPDSMSDEEEKQLLEIMEKSKNLQDGLKKMFDDSKKKE